jgi:uncharacterized iron-regulated protein
MTIFLLAALIPLLQQPTPAPPPTAASYVPQRVFDARGNAFTDFESMLADLAKADVVFVGEQHDDPNTHRLELAILEGLSRRGVVLVVAMEMFERDVQPALDQYLAGAIPEEQFLGSSRPWPRYATDYRPIVEFAKAHHLPVVASDVPRPIAADVAKNGMPAIEGLGSRRSLAAGELECPTEGPYYERFLEAMGSGGHEPPAGATADAADARARSDRFYLAQCVKDETMGESVARAVAAEGSRRATVVHFNGSFHTDYADGTAASARRRMPDRRIVVVSVLPIDEIDALAPDEDARKLGDYLLYTVKQ